MFVVQLVAHKLSPELGHHARALQLLDQGFAQRVKAALGHGPVFAHFGQVPAKRFGNPVALAVFGVGFGRWEQSLLALGARLLDPVQEAQGEQVGVNRHRPQAHVCFDLLVFSLVRNLDARDIAVLHHVSGQQLADLRGAGAGIQANEGGPSRCQGQGFEGCGREQGLNLVGVVSLEPELAPSALFPGRIAHVPGGGVVATGVVAGGLGPLEEPALATDVGLLVGECGCRGSLLPHVLIPPGQVRAGDRVQLGLLTQEAGQQFDSGPLDGPGLGQGAALEAGQPSIAGLAQGDRLDGGLRRPPWRREGRHVLMNQLPQRAGLRSRERHELLVELDVLWRVDLPLLGDRPICRACPIQRQLLRTVGAGQAREERVQVVSALHASFPQHSEDLSIASRQGQRAQPCLAHVVGVQGAFEGLATQDGLQIDRDTLAVGPESGGGSNEMMRDAHGRRVFRLAQL